MCAVYILFLPAGIMTKYGRNYLHSNQPAFTTNLVFIILIPFVDWWPSEVVIMFDYRAVS